MVEYTGNNKLYHYDAAAGVPAAATGAAFATLAATLRYLDQ